MKKLDILYEDKYIIVINKSYNVLSISTDNEKENTLFHEVFTYLKKKNKNNKIFIVHRLDKDTSGIMVLAKDIKTKNILQNNWEKVKREYIAIVHGVSKDKGEIRSYLKETKTLYTYSTIKKDGQLAITQYTQLKKNEYYSMLIINILTGRKNQIRVHMKDINHPIVGDKKYGIKDNFKRMFLHAFRLTLIHPVFNKEIIFETKIPRQFEMFFENQFTKNRH